jgi:tRNA (guanine-N7-)-methyltransferase
MSEESMNQEQLSPESATQEAAPKRKPIRSFVIRSGRMTAGQQKGWQEGWPLMGLELANAPADIRESFIKQQPLIVEIGFGMGASLVEMAQAALEYNFLGIEVHRPGVGALLAQAMELKLDNLKAFCADANEVLKQHVCDQSIRRLQLYFPDPWHKARHNKRRLVQPAFVQDIRAKLEIGGLFHMATDWQPYAEHMMEVMMAAEGFRNLAGDQQYAERPEYRPITKFEKRGERLGHGVWDLLFERIA